MTKHIPSALFLVALVAAIVLFASGNAFAGMLCVMAALGLIVATAMRMKRDGRLPSRER